MHTSNCKHTHTHHEKSNFKINSNRNNYYTNGFPLEATEGKLLGRVIISLNKNRDERAKNKGR